MKYYLFDLDFGGHRLEYVLHLISYASQHFHQNDTLTVVLHKKYEPYLTKIETSKIKLYFLSEDVCARYDKTRNYFIKRYHFVKLLRSTTIGADRILLIQASQVFPWLPLFFKNKKIVNSIEYVIPGWRDRPSFKQKLGDRLKFTFYRYANFNKIFLLNDDKFPQYYNKIYNTQIFQYLPDPIPTSYHDVTRQQEDHRKVFLHAGAMSPIKGTFVLIEAIKILPQSIKEKSRFIFCGKGQTEEINKRLVSAIEDVKKDSAVEVEFYNGFVPESVIMEQYARADYIVIPYFNTYQSSGNLGHAASFNKPVIGPSSGLLGHLIKTNKLGITVEDISSLNLKELITNCVEATNIEVSGDKYVQKCNIDNFCKLFFS